MRDRPLPQPALAAVVATQAVSRAEVAVLKAAVPDMAAVAATEEVVVTVVMAGTAVTAAGSKSHQSF